MSDFSRLTRRKFLWTTGASAAGAILLKGCGNVGSAPTDTAASPAVEEGSGIDEGQAPETTRAVLGYIPIVESAALIIAKEKGFFAKYGMPDVEVAKQANWAGARDNVTIGSAGGGIDGGQWQMPMPHLIHEGIITLNNEKVPMALLCQLQDLRS